MEEVRVIFPWVLPVWGSRRRVARRPDATGARRSRVTERRPSQSGNGTAAGVMVVRPRAVPPQPTLEDGTGNCADRQGEIDRLQAEVKALTDVEQLLQNIGVRPSWSPAPRPAQVREAVRGRPLRSRPWTARVALVVELGRAVGVGRSGRSHPLRTVPGQRALGAVRFCRAAPTLADPPRWPIEFARKLGVQASSRPYRLGRGVAVNDPETPEHAHQVNVRLDVDLPLLPSEAGEVVPEYPRGHRREPGPEPVDLLQRLLHLGGRRVPPDGAGVSAEPLPDQSGRV